MSELGNFKWKPRRGDLVWCPAVGGDKAVLVYGLSPSNKEWFEYALGKTHRMDDPELRFIPRFMQIWAWLNNTTTLHLHLWKTGSGPEAFQANAVPDGRPVSMKKGYSSSLDSLLAVIIDLIQSNRAQAKDIARAAESVDYEMHCIILAAKLAEAGVLPWTPSPGDLVAVPNRTPLRIFSGLSVAGTIQIDPGEEEPLEGKVWIPDPEQVLDHFEDFLPGYDGFFLGPADLYGQIVCSIQGSHQGKSNANDLSYSGKDPQHAVLKMLAGIHRVR